KHRNGEVRDVQMRFRPSEVKFVDASDISVDMKSYSTEGVETISSRMNREEFRSNSDFDTDF
ncbi:MAG: DnaB-like helicase C-terminal domain-containing protein, partial [Bacteroidales bacterium]|nr:DnaB-like helicase C-terminal domain-containing protein [Bacteroidales bacterium]